MNNILKGIKSLVLKPKLAKIIFLLVVIAFMYNVYNLLKTENNAGYYFAFYLAIPAYLFILGMFTGEKPEHRESIKENSMPMTCQNNDISQENFNDGAIDKMEKRIVKTYRKESIETIYFRNGMEYRSNQTNYFNEGEF